MKTIDEIWTFCAIDLADDTEGLISMQTADGAMPFVCADRTRIDSLRPLAQKIATQSGHRVVLKRFTTMTVVETIEPEHRSQQQ